MPLLWVLSVLKEANGILQELEESGLDFHLLISTQVESDSSFTSMQIAMPTLNVGVVKKVADLLTGHQPRNYLIVYDGDHPVVYSLLRATSALGDRLFFETAPEPGPAVVASVPEDRPGGAEAGPQEASAHHPQSQTEVKS